MTFHRKVAREFAVILRLTICAAGVRAQGELAVDAGNDQLQLPLGSAISLGGAASDGYDSLRWTQRSGKSGAQVLSPTTLFSIVEFTDTGTFVFQLRAYYGPISFADTTVISVRASLPFSVLAPVDSAEVQIGKPYVVRWQMDPSVGCAVHFSTDNGLTFPPENLLTTQGGSATDSVVWDVDPNFADHTPGIIRVADYRNRTRFVTGTFVLVKSLSQSTVPDRSRSTRALKIAVDRAGPIRISGFTDAADARIAVFDPRGRLLLSAATRNGIIGLPVASVASGGLFPYRIETEAGSSLLGRLFGTGR